MLQLSLLDVHLELCWSNVHALNVWVYNTLYDVVADMLVCNIVFSRFNLQMCHYIHFRTNTLWKRIKPAILPIMGQITVIP